MGIINKNHKADIPLVVITGGLLYMDNADRLLSPHVGRSDSAFDFSEADVNLFGIVIDNSNPERGIHGSLG